MNNDRLRKGNSFRSMGTGALLAGAAAAAYPCAAAHAASTIYEYQFTGDTYGPTTVATNLVGSTFSYVNANPGYAGGPPFIVQGGIDPDDPPYYVANADWFPVEDGFNEDYYGFSVSVKPGYSFNVNSVSFYANSRQAVLFDSQIEYSTSPSFSNPVSFDTNAFLIPATNVWNTFTASDSPITTGIGTYYFRIYNQVDPSGSGSISDLLNMSNITLTGTVQTYAGPTNLYWDPANSGAPGSGGTGTWLGANPWAEGAVDFSWDNTVALAANFGGASGGNVALGGNVLAANGLNFTTAGYNITGAAAQTLTIGGVITTSANATISSAVASAGPGTLTKAGSATLTLGGPVNFATGTALSILAGNLQLGATAGGVTVSALSIASSAGFDVNNDHLFVGYTSGTQASVLSTIRGYLANGYHSGTWNGTSGAAAGGGIDSSAAALNSHYALGYADGADGIVSGLASGQIEVKYTLYGDANLDGVVNGTDFGILAAHFGRQVSGWDQGDFNYDGVVNGSDFGLLAANFGQQANGGAVTLPASEWAALDAFANANGLMADVPEPSTVGMVFFAATAVVGRRRKRG